MKQKGIINSSLVQYNHGISPMNNNLSQKTTSSNIVPNKKLINTGKMVLNPYKYEADKPTISSNNYAQGKQMKIENRPTSSLKMKEDNLLPTMLQGKAMSLNSSKLPPREQPQTSHYNKQGNQFQAKKNDLVNIPKPQSKQMYQVNKSKPNLKQDFLKIENLQYKQPQQYLQPPVRQKESDAVQGLILEDYFKIPVATKADQISSPDLKMFNNNIPEKAHFEEHFQQRRVHSMMSEHLSESDRNNHSAGIIYNGDNDAEFFGFETEEIDLEKCIQELKGQNKHLSFNLMKCDLDDIRCSQVYEEFIQEIIHYLSNIRNIEVTDESQIQLLQYFVFNGLEDCLYSRDMNVEIIHLLKNNIQNYPQKAIETFAKRIENKFYMVEDPSKMDECFRLFLKYLHINNYLNQTIMNSVLKLIKMKRLRDLLCDFFKEQNIQHLINNENSLILLFTLNSYNCFELELPSSFSIERFERSNKLLYKLYKNYTTNN